MLRKQKLLSSLKNVFKNLRNFELNSITDSILNTQKIVLELNTINFDSPATIATNVVLLPGYQLTRIRVIRLTTFDTASTIAIGITGTLNKYLASTAVDLTSNGQTTYEFFININSVTTQENILITYTQNASTVGKARIYLEYLLP